MGMLGTRQSASSTALHLDPARRAWAVEAHSRMGPSSDVHVGSHVLEVVVEDVLQDVVQVLLQAGGNGADEGGEQAQHLAKHPGEGRPHDELQSDKQARDRARVGGM